MQHIQVYFVLLVYVIVESLCSQPVGSKCKLAATGKPGICKLITQCPSAKEQNNKGIRPIICSYHFNEVVVCCKDDSLTDKMGNGQIESFIFPEDEDDYDVGLHFNRPSKAEQRPPPAASPTPAQTQHRVAPAGNSIIDPTRTKLRKSQQKCLEYSAPVQTTLFAAPLSIDRTIIPTQLSNCLFESEPLIYGGSLVGHGEFPHMALLGFRNPRIWFCGGSLISEQFVLTAAHCVQVRGNSVSIVRLGELNINKPELNSEPEDIAVKRIFVHPDYKHPQVYNDIALIKLVRPATLSMYIRPACLWNKFEIKENRTIATGWGATEQDPNKINDDLLKVGLNIVEHARCKELYKNYTSSKLRKISTNIICAANIMGGDTCQGDSGGPLEITDPQNKCIHYIIGVTSAGRGCGSVVPGIYTRVSDYVDWIERVVWT